VRGMRGKFHTMLIPGLAVLAICATVQAQPAVRPTNAVDAGTVASALTTLVETQVKDMADALAIAAATPDARSADWEKIKPLLAAFDGRFQPAALWFALPDGSYYTLESGLTSNSLRDRPYFPIVMAGNPSLGELVVSKATGSNVTITAVPITRDGKVVGMLGASIYLEKLTKKLDQAIPLPPGMVFYALDSTGRIALHSESERIFQEATNLGSPTLTKAIEQMLATREGSVTYTFAGGRQTAVYRTSDLLGWKFAIRFPAP
jgi:hypothetical protein